jgi:isochorismate pyruvate lyase
MPQSSSSEPQLPDPAFRRAFTDVIWEREVGYCRALRAGDRVFVTGTAPVDRSGEVIAPGNAYEQAKACFEAIQRALAQVDVGMDRVTRTRMFVTDIERWAEYGRAHREVFGAHPPTTTMVEVRRLIHPDMLIEIEADAVAGSAAEAATPTRSSPEASS